MLKEALEYLTNQVKRADKPVVVDGVSIRNKTMLTCAGITSTVPDDIPARDHTTLDLASFIQAVATYSAGGASSPSVWHNGDSIRAILDDSGTSHRDDSIMCTLTSGAKFDKLRESASKRRSHQDFVKFLVLNFRNELEGYHPGLLGAIRQINIKTLDTLDSTARSGAGAGRESIGREVVRELVGSAELPETIKIKVRRWAELDYMTEVECLLVADLDDRVFCLEPLADELVMSELKAQDWLHAELLDSELECPVFYGSP